MTNQEAIERIEQHMRIHFASEYPHAVYITEALNMAIEALKEREPRVLTLEEVKNIKGKAFFLEERFEIDRETCRTWWSWAFFKKVYFSKKLHEEYFIFATDRNISNLYYPVNEYGKEWRCWSGQPSDSESGNTPWE